MKTPFTFLLLFLLSTVIYSQSIVANYKFNGTGEDSGPSNFNANNNGAIPTEDRFGNIDGAFYLDGIDDYLEIPNQEELNFGECDFAISMWIKTASTDMQMIIHNGASGLEPQYWLRIKDYASSLIDLKFLTSNGIPGSPFTAYNDDAIYDNNWHHIVVQRKSLWHEIYFDGVLVSADESSEIKNIINEDNILVGAQHPHPDNGFPNIFNHFEGSIDDLIFYKGSLTEEQVQDIFTGEVTSTKVTVPEENLIQIYPNPTTNKIEIKIQESHLINKVVRIVDLNGRTIKLHQLPATNIDVSELPDGVYLLVFNYEDKTISKQFVKQ